MSLVFIYCEICQIVDSFSRVFGKIKKKIAEKVLAEREQLDRK